MKIGNKNYTIQDTFDTPITVPDCFVYPANKIGAGNGEAKLYITSKDEMRSFFGGEGFTASCFLYKDDLLAYMSALQEEYRHPSQPYRAKKEMQKLWATRITNISQIEEDILEFNVSDQTQIQGPRGYVNSSDVAYQLIRELSLPLVSYVSIMRLADKTGKIVFYWKLFADFDAIADKKNALVYRYGKKGEEEPVQPKTTKKDTELRNARIGQGRYRERLLDECPFCPITKINDERLLIASHIKPWAIANDKERIDSKNGFMLSPLYDKLFDRGFITFTDDRKVIISNWLSPENQKRIGIKNNDFIQMLPMDEKRKEYLEYHRKYVFKG